MKELPTQNFQERQAESKEIKKVEFRIQDAGVPGSSELDDKGVESAAKSFLKNEEINIVSWKKLGVEIKNGVRWWGVEVNYTEK